MNLPSRADNSLIQPRRLTNRRKLLSIGIHAIGLMPLLQLTVLWVRDSLTANPIQFIEQFFGRAALNLLMAVLAVSPLVTLSGWNALIPHRRTLGLYSFFYFVLHFLTFAVLDYGLNWGEILRLSAEKPFIIFGSLAGLILLVLALTSFEYWMKRLKQNWRRLHKAVYLAGVLAVLHYALALKGSLATLSGDISRPLAMGALLMLLLILRLPAVRRRIIFLRHQIKK
jgi:sulfoxide reductase heme-binding subunit YedZ